MSNSLQTAASNVSSSAQVRASPWAKRYVLQAGGGQPSLRGELRRIAVDAADDAVRLHHLSHVKSDVAGTASEVEDAHTGSNACAPEK